MDKKQEIKKFMNLHNDFDGTYFCIQTPETIQNLLSIWFENSKNTVELNTAKRKLEDSEYPYSFIFELLMNNFLRQNLSVEINHPREGSDFYFKFGENDYEIECVAPESSEDETLMPEPINWLKPPFMSEKIYSEHANQMTLRLIQSLTTKAKRFNKFEKLENKFWIIAVDTVNLFWTYGSRGLGSTTEEILYNISHPYVTRGGNTIRYKEHGRLIRKKDGTNIDLKESSFYGLLKEIDGVIIRTSNNQNILYINPKNLNPKKHLDKKFLEKISDTNFDIGQHKYELKEFIK